MSSSAGSTLGIYRVPIYVVATLAALVLGVPFLLLVSSSWTKGAFIQFPPEGFTLDWYQSVLTDKKWIKSFQLSLWVSVIGTVIAVFFGTAAALAVSRLGPRLARVVRTIFIVPIALPPVAYAVGLYNVNFDYLSAIRKSPVALMAGESLLAMPYVFVLVAASVARLDPALRRAAMTLGAHWLRIILRVELPLLLGSIGAGAIFAFNLIFDEVTLSVFLLPPGKQTLPLQMLDAARESFSPQLTAASTMISVLALLLLGVVGRLMNRKPGTRTRKKKVAA